MKTVITYGTFDLFHVGHLRLLQRMRDLGDRLIVGVSTDEFNERKGKRTIVEFQARAEIVAGLACVDEVIPETDWSQKRADIREHNVSIFGMGDDWRGKFDHLRDVCDVIYLPRTHGISSTQLKSVTAVIDKAHVAELKAALDLMATIVERLE